MTHGPKFHEAQGLFNFLVIGTVPLVEVLTVKAIRILKMNDIGTVFILIDGRT